LLRDAAERKGNPTPVLRKRGLQIICGIPYASRYRLEEWIKQNSPVILIFAPSLLNPVPQVH
jgi:hypothetical protein